MLLITLYSFAQQRTCLLVQGVYHHTQLYLISLISADTLFLNPFLMSSLWRLTRDIDSITIARNVPRGMLNTMILSCCHYRVTMAICIGKHNLALLQIPEICTVCDIHNMNNMHNMHLLFTQAGKVLDIHLVLWRKPSAIQIVPLNKQHSDPDELSGRIKHRVERICPVVFERHIGQQSIQKKRQDKEDVLHVYCTDPRRYLFVSPKILKNTGEVRCNWH